MAKPLPDDIKECPDFQSWLRCHEFKSPGIWTFRNVFTRMLHYHFLVGKNMIDGDSGLDCDLDKFTIRPGNIIDPGNTNNVPGIIVTTGEGVRLEQPWITSQMIDEPDYATMKNIHQATVDIALMCLHFDADMVAKISDEVLALVVSNEVPLFTAWEWLLLYTPSAQTSPKLARKAENPEAFENYYESIVQLKLTYEYSTITRVESRRMQDYTLSGPHTLATSIDVTSEKS